MAGENCHTAVPLLTNEDRSDSEGQALLVDVGLVLVVEHVIQGSNLPGFVADDGEVDVGGAVRQAVNVLDPTLVRRDVVRRQANQLRAGQPSERSRAT